MPNQLKPRDVELLNMPSINSQLPIEFANGNSWTHVNGECACCKKEIPDDKVFGSLNKFNDDLFTVEAVGYCKPCNMVTRFLFRLHSDMRLTAPANGTWQEWRPSNSISSKILDFLKKPSKVLISTRRMK